VNALWQTPVVVALVLAWLAQPPRSLGEAAQKEALRRSATPRSTALLSNLGQPPEIPLSAMVQAAQTAGGAAGADQKKDETGKEKEETKKDETWWRNRITAAREALAQSERNVQALDSRINALQRDVVNLDNPVQRNKARQELQTAMADQEQARRAVEASRQAIVSIQDEARRDGVPPGWVRFEQSF
jgi:hypothetical protein